MNITINQHTITTPTPTLVTSLKAPSTSPDSAPASQSKGKMFTKDAPTILPITPITPAPADTVQDNLQVAIAAMLAAVQGMEITVTKMIASENAIGNKIAKETAIASKTSEQENVQNYEDKLNEYHQEQERIIGEYMCLAIILPCVGIPLMLMALKDLGPPPTLEPVTPVKPAMTKKEEKELLVILKLIKALLADLSQMVTQKAPMGPSEIAPSKNEEETKDQEIAKILSVLDKALLLISQQLTPELGDKKEPKHVHQEICA